MSASNNNIFHISCVTVYMQSLYKRQLAPVLYIRPRPEVIKVSACIPGAWEYATDHMQRIHSGLNSDGWGYRLSAKIISMGWALGKSTL